jgi:hypothetical protein
MSELEQADQLALAHLKSGKEPGEVAELTGVSHPKCLKLRRQLKDAEAEIGGIERLFDMPTNAIELLVNAATKQTLPAIMPIEDSMGELVNPDDTSDDRSEKLNRDMHRAANALLIKIESVSTLANNADTILAMAEAISKLNNSFFPPAGKNSGGNDAVSGGFEDYLKD